MSGPIQRRCYLLAVLCCLALSPAKRVAAQTAQSALDTMLDRAQAAQNANDYKSAALWYGRATSLAPGMAELWSNRGVMELLAGKAGESIVSMHHALDLNPDLFTPTLFLGKAYLETGHQAQALLWLRRAHAARPDDVETLLTLGRAWMEDGQGGESATAFSAVTRLDPDNPNAWFGLGTAALRVIQEDGSRLATSYAHSVWSQALLADDFLEQGKPIQAAAAYKDALHHASAAETAELLTNARWMQSQAESLALPADSVQVLQKLSVARALPAGVSLPDLCTTTSPRSLNQDSLRKAACAFWAGDPERCASLAAAALPRTPDPAQALYWLVKSNERLAVNALGQFEALSTDSAANLILLGNLYRMQRQPDKALAEYSKALALDPRNPAALTGAVLACIDAVRLDDAAAFDRRALNYQPLDPELNLLMAEVLDTEDQQSSEGPYLERARGVPPQLQPRLHYLMARLDVHNGKIVAAIKEYELALPGDKDGTMHYQLARLYRQVGNLAAAQDAMAKAKALIAKRDAAAVVVLQQATPSNQ